MKLIAVGPDAAFYRALTPKWAYAPESGDGAAVKGGRFNRAGIRARYLAATPEAALGKYHQESTLLRPATITSFQVTADPLVDFTAGYTDDQLLALKLATRGSVNAPRPDAYTLRTHPNSPAAADSASLLPELGGSSEK